MSTLLEIAAFSLEGAVIAGKAGADRIELCADYSAGGLTPAPDVIEAAGAQLGCPFFVMIRPVPGGFRYDAPVIMQMERELLAAKAAGASGFVFGILQEDGSIDEQANARLVGCAAPLPCTFHRAFDDLPDQPAALEALVRCGFARVLTSGGPGPAADHTGALGRLVAQAKERIIVMPGGGIRPGNLGAIRAATAATEYHSAAVIGQHPLPDAGSVAAMKALLSAALPAGRN